MIKKKMMGARKRTGPKRNIPKKFLVTKNEAIRLDELMIGFDSLSQFIRIRLFGDKQYD